MGLYAETLFGSEPNTSLLPAQMMNITANNSTDWGAIIADGIRGAADGAIRGLVTEKFQDGQLKASAQKNSQMMTWALIAVAAYLVLK